jgi:hypothetical protein
MSFLEQSLLGTLTNSTSDMARPSEQKRTEGETNACVHGFFFSKGRGEEEVENRYNIGSQLRRLGVQPKKGVEEEGNNSALGNPFFGAEKTGARILSLSLSLFLHSPPSLSLSLASAANLFDRFDRRRKRR